MSHPARDGVITLSDRDWREQIGCCCGGGWGGVDREGSGVRNSA